MRQFKCMPSDCSIRKGTVPSRHGLTGMALAASLLTFLAACAMAPGARNLDVRQQMTIHDRHIAAMAVQVAMERRGDNQSSTWTNGMSGNHGVVVPRRSYWSPAGALCRRYEEEMTVAGVTATYTQTACRDNSGHWTTVT